VARLVWAGVLVALVAAAFILWSWRQRPAPAPPRAPPHAVAEPTLSPLDGLERGLVAYRQRWSRLPQEQLPPHPADAALRRRLGLAAGAPLAPAVREFQAAHGLRQTGAADAGTRAALNRGAGHYEQSIERNLAHARALAAPAAGRYVLVDTASARLWMIEDGIVRDSMRVVVGSRAMPTPSMSATIRYAVLNPYWNLPPDLIRKRARAAVRRGPGVIAGERLEALSDWTPAARTLDPRRIDWRAVAAGRRFVNLRQRPGPRNMMGRIKFMMPNDRGIYLHDTPLREVLGRDDRHASSGCARLEDAGRLARWLFDGTAPRPNGAAEQRVDLPRPVPVYLAYFTALPSPAGGIAFHDDVYRRDGAAAAPRSTPRRNRTRPPK
jgi:murein L,D-transpeptidase YcbB/YkuD